MPLDTAQGIIELADKFNDLADQLHNRASADAKAKRIDQSTAQSLFTMESDLRDKADTLCAKAVSTIIMDAECNEAALDQVMDLASTHLARIQDIRDGIKVFADVIQLGAAILAKQPGPILEAAKALVSDLGKKDA